MLAAVLAGPWQTPAVRGSIVLLALVSGCHREPRAPAPSTVAADPPTPEATTIGATVPGCGRPGTWRDGPVFVTARGGHHARLLPDGLVLVWGGSKNLHVVDGYTAESFDPDGRRAGTGYDGLPPEAIAEAAPPAPRGAPVGAALVRLADGRVLAAGGADGTGAPLRTVTIDGCPAAPLGSPRAGAAAVLLADGRVLVTGGRTGGPREMDPFIRTTELFTP